MKSKWSLKTKIMLNLAFMLFLGLGLFIVSMTNSFNDIADLKKLMIESAADNLIEEVDQTLAARYADSMAFSSTEAARSMDPQRIEAYMSDIMVDYAPYYQAMYVVDRSGRVIAVSRFDKEKKPVGSESFLNKNMSETRWFSAVMNGEVKPGMVLVQDPADDKEIAEIFGGDGRLMTFSAPIRNRETGDILGVWVNKVSWHDAVILTLSDSIDQLKTPDTDPMFAYLVDKNGRYLSHQLDQSMLGKVREDFVRDLESTKVSVIDTNHDNFSGLAIEVDSPSQGYAHFKSLGWQLVLQAPLRNSDFGLQIGIAIGGALLMLICGLMALSTVNGSMRILSDVNDKLAKEAVDVKEASTSISQASQALAQASTEQASALQETAASIEEMSAMIKKSADNAEKSRNVAQNSQRIALQGKETVGRMVNAMTEINESNAQIMSQIDESNRRIGEIIKVITEIGNKTKVINEIVFQTKLLSFNASVEAARAGEHGKGFAVVAEEVGNLAQMSGSAARDISTMLNDSIQKVEGIVTDTKVRVSGLIEQGKSKVESGTLIANECGGILEEVVKNVNEVNMMISEISTATKEQAQGIMEITKAMHQLDEVTHENATTSQQAATSSSSLNAQAEELFSAVATLKETIHGSGELTSTKSSTFKAKTTPKLESKVKRIAPKKSKGTEKLAEKSNVIKISPEDNQKRIESLRPAAFNNAVGSDVIPSEHDPRFKDV